MKLSFTLFLDFDGVLHPSPCDKEELLIHRCYIEDLLEDYPELQIVISSSWRLDSTLEELCEPFRPEVRERILGVTPVHPQRMPMHREREILDWMEQHRSPDERDRWLAIDDKPEWFSPGCRHLFITRPDVGLDGHAALGLRIKLAPMLGIDPYAGGNVMWLPGGES